MRKGNVYSTNLRHIIVIIFISNTKDRSSSELLTLVIKGQNNYYHYAKLGDFENVKIKYH